MVIASNISTCGACGKGGINLLTCAGCQREKYCSKGKITYSLYILFFIHLFAYLTLLSS